MTGGSTTAKKGFESGPYGANSLRPLTGNFWLPNREFRAIRENCRPDQGILLSTAIWHCPLADYPPRGMTPGAILYSWREPWEANGPLTRSRLLHGSRQRRWKPSSSANGRPTAGSLKNSHPAAPQLGALLQCCCHPGAAFRPECPPGGKQLGQDHLDPPFASPQRLQKLSYGLAGLEPARVSNSCSQLTEALCAASAATVLVRAEGKSAISASTNTESAMLSEMSGRLVSLAGIV